MDESFQKKVRSAAVAGWWTLLAAVIITALQGVGTMLLARAHPAWMTNLWGGISWETIQNLVLWMIAVFRLLIWTMLLVVIWLTIWSVRLRRIA